MFWGLILEPYKRYTQIVQKPFHITNAALDVTTGDNEVCQVMVGAQDKDFLICTLQKGKAVQTPLQLYFTDGTEVSFTASGKSTVHLTGFLDPDNMYDDVADEDETESEEEVVSAKSKKDKKRKADSSLEENGNVKKQKNEVAKKKQNVEDSSDDDDDSEPDIAKLLQDEDSDENDDTYLPDTSAENVAQEDENDDDDDDDSDDEDIDDSDDDEEDSDAEEVPVEAKPADKKQKNKKEDKPQQNGFSEKKNKGNKENEQKSTQQKSDEKPSMEKKVLNGNVSIEDLKLGQGQVAKTGKMVQVYYEGKLKNNNKMFDSCQKGPGFKFKLGKKEVIPGWEVGIVGMKVGGKRRIVIPPGMAYGKKGSPPVIPPNATLVFDVELKNIH